MKDELAMELVDEEDVEDVPTDMKVRKQKSNLRFLDRIKDSWYRLLEWAYGGNCYFIGKDIATSLLLRKDRKVQSRVLVFSEARSDSFGVNQRMSLETGFVFGNAVQIRKFLWTKLYFFKPITIEGTPIKLALARRCFVENDTIVLDGRINEFYLNLPSHMAAVLRSLAFDIEDSSDWPLNVKEVVGCHISYPTVQKLVGIVCVRTDNEDGTSKLSISCAGDTKVLERIMPTVLEVDVEPFGEASVASSEKRVPLPNLKRFACGYNFTRGETTGFTDATHETFALANRHGALLMPTEEAKNLERALKALSDSVCLGPTDPIALDEVYVGDKAIYLRWHRGWTNALKG